MPKLKIKLVKIGHFANEFDEEKILAHTSEIFDLSEEIETFRLRGNSDIAGWGYSDGLLNESVPDCNDADFLMAFTTVPMQLNYYTRRLSEKRAIVTFYEIQSILKSHNIPIESFILRVLYSFSLIYMRFGNRFPLIEEAGRFTHDETRGCLFDMNGLKTDIYRSCEKPIICLECEQRLINEKISLEKIRAIQSELKGIKKGFFYSAIDFIENHPGWSVAISIGWTLLSGIAGSLIASYIHS